MELTALKWSSSTLVQQQHLTLGVTIAPEVLLGLPTFNSVPLIRNSIFARNDPFSHLRSHIHNHLRPKSSWRVTHDSHKLQTKAIYHSTRRYMNRRELQSDQLIHVQLLCVLSFPPSDGISALARATPSNHTWRTYAA